MPHPIVFLALIIPFGLTSGFVSVTLGYQLTQRGVSAIDVAAVIALSYLPHTWKFLWAPLVDTTLTRKRWYAMSAVGCGLGLCLAGVATDRTPVSLVLLNSLLLAGNFAATLLGMSVESLMAVTVPDSHRGRVAGWFQAGNLGGMGGGGGLALWLIQGRQWSTGAAAGALFAICMACCVLLPRLHEPPRDTRPQEDLLAHAVDIVRDVVALARSRIGALAVLICFLPIGSGAAQNLWSTVAGDWHASAETVALVNGALGGVVAAAGCLTGGWLCDHMGRRAAYCLFGALQLLCAIAMALSPRTSAQFVAWTMIYAFITGLTYAGFSAVVLEAIGRKTAATKYNLLASLSNMPIAYVTLIDGFANDRWGTRGMLLVEAACGVAGILLFVVVAGATRRRIASGIPAEAPGRDAAIP
jgi:MFS family permease